MLLMPILVTVYIFPVESYWSNRAFIFPDREDQLKCKRSLSLKLSLSVVQHLSSFWQSDNPVRTGLLSNYGKSYALGSDERYVTHTYAVYPCLINNKISFISLDRCGLYLISQKSKKGESEHVSRVPVLKSVHHSARLGLGEVITHSLPSVTIQCFNFDQEGAWDWGWDLFVFGP